MAANAAGAGPWFAALLADGTFVGNTYPLGSVASKVGPFDVWSDCLAFLAQWRTSEGETINMESQLKRGRELCDYHGRMRRLRYCQSGKRRKRIADIKAVCIKPKKQYK